MIVLNHEYSKLTLAPKSFSIFKGLSKSIFAVSNWIFQDSSCDKPKGMPYSNREWNRNSAFIMSQYELSHGNAVSGSVND